MSEITKNRLISIDALRGIAAFLVVVFHVFGSAAIFKDQIALENLTDRNFLYFFPAYGYIGVYLFFVISGFCIHLRWAKSMAKDPSTKPTVDFFAFWKRRWIRLYPAYLAAIVLFLVWEYSQGKLVLSGFFVWDMISHVLMIHNFDNRTVYSMNGVFWTLAIEEQLYMLYFLLLALRQKFGWAVTLAITFMSRFLWLAVSLFFVKMVGYELPFLEGALANWWIWALGAYAVENFYRVIEFPRWCRSLILASLFWVAAASLHYLGFATPATKLFVNLSLLFEPFLWGGGFFFLINNVTAREREWMPNGFKYKALMIAAFIGLFSYSLYLTHEVVFHLLAGMNRFLICVFCLIFAYLFFLIFEKPFMLFLARQKGS